jgi:branched-chain amino acid transport system permease protein
LRRICLVAVAAAGVIYGLATGGYALFLASTIVVYAIAAMGQGLLVGKAGQISIGGAAFLYIGAFTAALTRGTVLSNFPLPLLVAGAVGGLVGLIIGVPALRLKGLYLLLITLALQFIVSFVGFETQRHRPSGFTAPPIHIGNYTITTARATFGILLVVAVVVAALLVNLYQRAPGRMWAAVREHEMGANAMGISVVRWKLVAFVTSSVVTSAGGSLLVYLTGSESYQTFTLTLAIELLLMVFIGGADTIAGPCVGAAIVTLIPVVLTAISNALPEGRGISGWLVTNTAFLQTAVFGAALLCFALYARGGLVGLAASTGRPVVHRLRSSGSARHRKGEEVNSTAADNDISAVEAVAQRSGPDHEAIGADLGAYARPSSAAPSDDEYQTSALELHDVFVRYPTGAQAVNDVSLGLPGGSVGAVIGRNGAGKTSLMRAVAGYDRAENVSVAGDIMANGMSLRTHDKRSRSRAGIAMVPERDKIFDTLTVLQHLRLVGLSRSEARAVLEQYPELKPREGAPAGLLSGGQRQLLALAVAMARKPHLLLVDEVSQGLAPIAVQSVVDKLLSIKAEHAPTILLSDQSLIPILDAVTNVYMLEHGELVSQGAPAPFADAERRSLAQRKVGDDERVF